MYMGGARVGLVMAGIVAGVSVWACTRGPASDRGGAPSSPSHPAPGSQRSSGERSRATATAPPRATVATGNDDPARAIGLPAEGTELSDFVPKGWTLRQEKWGDLGGSSHPDAVIEVVKPVQDTAELSEEQGAALVVLLGRSSGWKRVGFNAGLTLCAACGGAMWGGDLPWPGLEIHDGTLEIDLMWGARDTGFQAWTFRYEAQSGRLRCISTTSGSWDRLTGASTSTRRDYLTGQVVETEESLDEQGNSNAAPPRTRVEAPEIRYFEDVAPEFE